MSKLTPDQVALVKFVQKYAPAVPLAERVQVYRGLADFTEVMELVKALTAKAQIMEEAEAKCLELDLNLSRSLDRGGGR